MNFVMFVLPGMCLAPQPSRISMSRGNECGMLCARDGPCFCSGWLQWCWVDSHNFIRVKDARAR